MKKIIFALKPRSVYVILSTKTLDINRDIIDKHNLFEPGMVPSVYQD